MANKQPSNSSQKILDAFLEKLSETHGEISEIIEQIFIFADKDKTGTLHSVIINEKVLEELQDYKVSEESKKVSLKTLEMDELP